MLQPFRPDSRSKPGAPNTQVATQRAVRLGASRGAVSNFASGGVNAKDLTNARYFGALFPAQTAEQAVFPLPQCDNQSGAIALIEGLLAVFTV